MIVVTGMTGLRAPSPSNIPAARVTPTEERTELIETEEWTGHLNTVGSPSPGLDMLNRTQGPPDTALDAIRDTPCLIITKQYNKT